MAEEMKTMTPAPPSVSYLHMDQDSMVPQAPSGKCGYLDDRSTPQIRPHETKDHCQDQQRDCLMPMEVDQPLNELSHDGSSGNVFDGETYAHTSFDNMQHIRGHGDIFSATPDLYPMHYTGEPSQPPAINSSNDNQIFGHYPYEGCHKQPYGNNLGYYAYIPSPFQMGYEDESTRFQRINGCTLPSHSTPTS